MDSLSLEDSVTSSEEEKDSDLYAILDEEEEYEEQSEKDIANLLNPFQGPPLHKLYKIVECISRGSPGSVFIVKAKEDGKLYALKKIECHDESDAKDVFYEATDLKKLKHPFISSYKEFFVTYEKQGSTVFTNIISQYFPDGNLKQFIKQYQDKKKKCLNRNIKPSNIFQWRGAMVLSDLGVASIMGDLRTNTRQTFQGTVFMAPEIGVHHHNMKTDLYSVGGVLLNIMTTSVLSEHEFYKKLGEIKEAPEVLNVVLDLISHIYSKSMINIVQMLLRHKHNSRPSTLEFIKSGFVQECMAQADSGQLEIGSWQKDVGSTKIYHLTESRDNVHTVLEYIADVSDNEECVADGLSALADILRDNVKAHESIDQKARNMISLAMWNNIFNKDIQIPGCYVLSNLVAPAKPGDVLFTPDIVPLIHKIMAGHEYSPEVQLAAVNLILALSADVKISQTIVQLGGIHDILKAMKHARYHATLNSMCCMALWSLCTDSENLKIAVEENAVRNVCLALSIHKVSPDVCEAAAAALVSLLLDDGCYDFFSELDCSGNLVAAIHLHTKNEKVVKNCCKVLATTVETDEDCAFRFIATDNEDDSPTGIPTVMKAYKVHKDNADVVESIVRLLLELSQYDDIAAEMQAANVGPLLLSEVYNRYKENKAIMGPVEKALGRLDSPSISFSYKASSTVPNQAPLPSRPFGFDGEVLESCPSMLRKWKGTDQHPTKLMLKNRK